MLNFITVKWGTKYNASHVNKVHEMIKENCTLPFNFYCYTDDPTDVDAIIVPIDNDLEKYWGKLDILGRFDGTNIFFDLDIRIQNNIDSLLDYHVPGKITLVECYWKDKLVTDGSSKDPRRRFDMYANSSIMIWKGGEVDDIHKHFWDDCEWYMLQYKGVCRYLFHEHFDRLHFLPKYLVYSRIWGISEDDDFDEQYRTIYDNLVKSNLLPWRYIKLHHYPPALICLFNGPTEDWMYED